MKIKQILAGSVCYAIALTSCSKESIIDTNNDTNTNITQTAKAATGDNSSLLLGNPTKASTISQNNYLLEKNNYSLSYNNSRGTCNWVAWHLYSDDIGSASRSDDFKADASLPSSFFKAQPSDYKGSGFDKGHLCPSADRTLSTAANIETFLMTNMMPQAPKNNQHTWESLESYTRTLVNGGKEAYVIAGCYGMGGTGSNGGVTNTIANGKITVPSRVWKIVVVINNGDNDLSRIDSSTRVIAVDMPNSQVINTKWKNYRVTVKSIEMATGYNFLSSVPTAVQDVIEKQIDNL